MILGEGVHDAVRWGCGAWLVAWIGVGGPGCFEGGTHEPTPDGGPDAGLAVEAGSPAVAEPAAPAEPAEPRFEPCPAGWIADGAEPPVTCLPWSARLACAGASAQWPGTNECARVGSECPVGEFPEGLPEGVPVLFVRAGAPPGGTGTREAPFGSITEAMAPAGPGTILALSRGTFDESVRVDDGVTLWGACVAETTVTNGNRSGVSGVLSARGAATVQNLRVSGERSGLWLSGARVDLQLTDVLVEGTRGMGLWVADGARVAATGLVIRDTREDDGVGRGRGVVVEGGQVSIERGVLERVRDAALSVLGPASTATLEQVAVLDTLGTAAEEGLGLGLGAGDRATVTARRLVIERARGGAVTAANGATVVLEDAVIADTLDEGLGGRAISAAPGARLEVRRLVARQSHEVAISLDGASLDLADVVVRDTSGDAAGDHGIGLEVQAGGEAVVARGVFERCRSAGLFAAGEGTTLEVSDVRVRDGDGQESDGRFGRGISIQGGAQASLQRVALDRSRDVGLMVGQGARVTALDLAVDDTEGRRANGWYGQGVVLSEGGALRLRRVRLARNRYAGVFVDGAGSALVAEDLTVLDTRSQQSDGLFGRAVEVQGGAQAEIVRARLERNREVSVCAMQSGSALRIDDVVVLDTLERECATGICAGAGSGVGLGAYLGATVEMTRFVVSGSALSGVQIARDGAVDLHDGEVSRNLIGANLQVEGFDVVRLTDGVTYRDNGKNFDSSALVVPEAAPPPGG